MRLWSVTIFAGLVVAPAVAQPGNPSACPRALPDGVDLRLPLAGAGLDCLRLGTGFSPVSGSFVELSDSIRNALGGTLRLRAEYGVQQRGADVEWTHRSLGGTPLDGGFALYGRRFRYDQQHESSFLAFDHSIREFDALAPADRMDYVSHSVGGWIFVRYPVGGQAADLALAYGYDASSFEPRTQSAITYFGTVDFTGAPGFNPLHGIRTSRVVPSFTFDNVDNALAPAHGSRVELATAIAGLGGNVDTVEPLVEATHYRHGFFGRQVVAVHFRGRLITAYGGNGAPPFDHYYMGGEGDLRGFADWSISPIAYFPTQKPVPVLNPDGTPRVQTVVTGGVATVVPLVMSVPAYQMVSTGGDTNLVANLEYRVPIAGPFTLAGFADAGTDWLAFPDQIRLNSALLNSLNFAYPSANFEARPRVVAGTGKLRLSTGLELQVLVPRIQAPLRFSAGWNPLTYRGLLPPPPLAVDANAFPNRATFVNAVQTLGRAVPWEERQWLLRVSIGRTFGRRTLM